MKIFKDWNGDEKSSFVMFLAKENQRQKRKLRNINKYFNVQSEVDLQYIINVQRGQAIESSAIFMLAKDHFGFSDRKNKT